MPPRPTRSGGEVRLHAFLAHAGVASRRASEELIAAGRVSVNGARVTTPGTKIIPGKDRVEVDGQRIESVGLTWLALHKPRGYVTTRSDPYGRKTIYELLPDRFRTLFHVGRLDRDSEGLLLLTNDGPRANRMLHPSYGITKEYEVDVEGEPSSQTLRALEQGVQLADGVARADEVRRLHQAGPELFRLRIVLREGRNREVRRMLEAVGHKVRRLTRKRFGPISLGELPRGKWRVVAPAELSALEGAMPRPPAPDETRARRPARAPEPRRRQGSAKGSPARRESAPPEKSAGAPPGSRRGAKPRRGRA